MSHFITNYENFILGTVHITEVYSTGCTVTSESDILFYVNLTLAISYLAIFVFTNMSILWFMRDKVNIFEGFRVKTMTIGLIFLAVTLFGCMLLVFKPREPIMIIHLNVSILLLLCLFAIKEGSFTRPYILEKLHCLLCLQNSSTTHESLETAQNRLDEDDGGIFMGNPSIVTGQSELSPGVAGVKTGTSSEIKQLPLSASSLLQMSDTQPVNLPPVEISLSSNLRLPSEPHRMITKLPSLIFVQEK